MYGQNMRLNPVPGMEQMMDPVMMRLMHMEMILHDIHMTVHMTHRDVLEIKRHLGIE